MDRIQLRRDTAARWAEINPVLLEGEVGFETDTRLRKIGNGVSRWNELDYLRADGIINDLTTGGADKALSAEMGKELEQKTNNLKHTLDSIVGVDSGEINLSVEKKLSYYIDGSTGVWAYRPSSSWRSSIVPFYPNTKFTIIANSSGIRFALLKAFPITEEKVSYCDSFSGIKMVGGTFDTPEDCKFLYVLRNYADGTDYTPLSLRIEDSKGTLTILDTKILTNTEGIANNTQKIEELEFNIKKPLVLEFSNAMQEQVVEFPIKRGETWYVHNASDSGRVTVYTMVSTTHTQELVSNLQAGSTAYRTLGYDTAYLGIIGSVNDIKLTIYNQGIYNDITDIKQQIDTFIPTITNQVNSKQEQLSELQLGAVNSGINEELVSHLSDLLPQSEKTYNVSSTYNTRPGYIAGSDKTWYGSYSHYIIPIPIGVKSISIKQNDTSVGTMAYLKSDAFVVGNKADFCEGKESLFSIPQGGVYEISEIPSDCKYLYFLHDVGSGDRTPETITFSATEGSIKILQEDVEVLKEDVKELKRGIVLPERYNTEAERIYQMSSVDNHDFSMCVFTDPHSTDTYKYAKYKQILDKGIVDCIIGLGDVESYDLIGKPKSTVIPALTYLTSIAGRTDSCFYAVGNHDVAITNPNDGVLIAENNLTKKEQFNVFVKHLSKSAVFDKDNPYGAYYYTDFGASKIRVIVLNTSEIYEDNGSLSAKYVESVMIRQQQINWFVNKALDFSDKEDKEDWSVLCCGHSSVFNDILTQILEAFKTGASVSIDKTLYRQLTYSNGSWDSPVNNNAPYKIAITKDFSSQGAIDVIGILYGHVHWDSSRVTNGILSMEFICDNGELDNIYATEVNGITAGKYYIAYGDHYLCTELGNYPNVTKIGFNKYLANNPSTSCVLYDENGLRMETNLSWSNNTNHDGYDVELTNFVPERTPDTITTESCKILSIDKTNRKVKVYSYGIPGNKEVNY